MEAQPWPQQRRRKKKKSRVLQRAPVSCSTPHAPSQTHHAQSSASLSSLWAGRRVPRTPLVSSAGPDARPPCPRDAYRQSNLSLSAFSTRQRRRKAGRSAHQPLRQAGGLGAALPRSVAPCCITPRPQGQRDPQPRFDADLTELSLPLLPSSFPLPSHDLARVDCDPRVVRGCAAGPVSPSVGPQQKHRARASWRRWEPESLVADCHDVLSSHWRCVLDAANAGLSTPHTDFQHHPLLLISLSVVLMHRTRNQPPPSQSINQSAHARFRSQPVTCRRRHHGRTAASSLSH